MSNLEEAMREHMASIVFSENRPFCYRDFLRFEVDGREYRMAHGTFRNKISKLAKPGEIELAYNSGTAFYTLTGHRFGKPITPNHAGVYHSKMDSFSKLIDNLTTERAALHDIRLKFNVPNIWHMLSFIHQEFPVNQRSKDIFLPTWNINDLLVRVVVHKSDTVSVSVACSLAPVAADTKGIIRLSNALTRVEERLATLLKDVGNAKGSGVPPLEIPDHAFWLVTMWHFGVDSLVEYTGDKFAVTWEIGEHILLRAYTKTMKDKKTGIRLERQEYPNKTLPAAIDEKLNAGGRTQI